MRERSFPVTRRGFSALLLQAAALWGGRALADGPSADRGIGGTGATQGDPDGTQAQDRGIGGTGVVGTIRRFGSIVVNDLRISFPPDVPVTIDGRRGGVRDLRVGHVVHVLADGHDGMLSTRAIVADSEVVGPVDEVGEDHLVVLGQRVALPEGTVVPGRRRGDHLAVSGLRRLDGVVVASLVERRPAGLARLRGPVGVGADGVPVIGGLRVAGLPRASVGRRVSLVGVRQGGAFHPSAVTVEPRVPFARADRLSLETFVARTPDGLRTGSSLDVSAAPSVLAEVDAGASPLAVVTAEPRGGRRLNVLSVRVERDSNRSGHDFGASSGPEGPGIGSAPGIDGTRGGGPDGPSAGTGPSGASGAPGANGGGGAGSGGRGGGGR